MTAAKTCRGPECDRPSRALGLCKSHYNQHSRGRPLAVLRTYRPGGAPPASAPRASRVLDRSLDALWCLGHAATAAEIGDRAGLATDTVQGAIRRNPTLFVQAGGVERKRGPGSIPTFRLSDAGLARLDGDPDDLDDDYGVPF